MSPRRAVWPWRCGSVAVAIFSMAAMVGCRSHFVEATIDNRGSHPLHVVEVDYPSASFGVSLLEAHSQYHYRFKILGSGSVKLSFTDDQGKAHASNGPELDEGQEGTLAITLDDAGQVRWTPTLKAPE